MVGATFLLGLRPLSLSLPLSLSPSSPRRNFVSVCLVLRQPACPFKARENSLEMCDITIGRGQWNLGRAITQATPPPPPPPSPLPRSALLRLSLCERMMSCFSTTAAAMLKHPQSICGLAGPNRWRPSRHQVIKSSMFEMLVEKKNVTQKLPLILFESPSRASP